jgi:hypothetical protein
MLATSFEYFCKYWYSKNHQHKVWPGWNLASAVLWNLGGNIFMSIFNLEYFMRRNYVLFIFCRIYKVKENILYEIDQFTGCFTPMRVVSYILDIYGYCIYFYFFRVQGCQLLLASQLV